MSGRDASAAGADAAHDNSVGQPHTEAEGDVIVAAEKGAAQISSPAHPLGEAGPRFNRASPFMIGMAGAAGVAVTYGGVELLVAARGAVILIVVAGFVAIGLEPAVSWLVRHRFSRWVPRIIGRTVEVPPLVTVVAVMLGGALLGIVGAILAIPIAAAILLLARETLFPQLDRR